MKRTLALLATAALAGSLALTLPARAAIEIPATVQIDDPVGDANYLNDQSLVSGVPEENDNTTAADVGNASDLMKIWYSNDATTVSVHIQVQQAPPATQAYIYRVYSNPGEGTVTSSTLGCLRFFAFIPGDPGGGGYQGDQYAGLLDYCDKGTDYASDAAVGQLAIEDGPDGTAIMSITVPRSYSPKLADGQVFTSPLANVRNLQGTGPQGDGQLTSQDTDGRWRGTTQIDNTKIGTDYKIVSAAPKCKKSKKTRKKVCPKPPATAPTPAPSPSA